MTKFTEKIIGAEVIHEEYGFGKILSVVEEVNKEFIATIRFEDSRIKKFSFPRCVESKVIDFVNSDLMKEVQDHYSSKEDFNEIEKPKVETCDLILDKISSINLDEELAYKYILNVHNDNNILEILIERSSKIIYKYHETRKIINSDRNIVIFTLALLSFNHYQSNFWRTIRDHFKELYERTGSQSLESSIRDLVTEQTKYADVRHITSVLVHAGIPKKYLQRFYDFAYDIYKINFDYQLSEDTIEEILLETIEGISDLLDLDKNSGDENKLVLNVTKRTYDLIKYTKLGLLHYKESYVEIIKQILQIIDSWNWGYQLNGDFPQILIDVCKRWSVKRKKLLLSNERTYEYIGKPHYKLDTTNCVIKVIIPNRKEKALKQEDIDKLCVECIFGNKHTKLKKHEFKIIEKIGYHNIEIEPQVVNELGVNILFNLYKGDDIIYTTGDLLNRKFIIFDSNGKEIENFKEYNGIAYVAYPKGLSFEGMHVNIFENHVGYNIAAFQVDKNTIYRCDNDIIFFSEMLTPGIYGTQVKRIEARVDGKTRLIFNNVSNFVFESDIESENLIIMFNSVKYELNDLDPIVTNNGVSYVYNIIIKGNILSNNLNKIAVYNKQQAARLIGIEEFIIDRDLSFNIMNTQDPLKKTIDIKSSFINAIKKEECDFAIETYFSCSFRIGNNNIEYLIDPEIKRFKWNKKDNWQLIGELELRNNTSLYISSKRNTIKLLDENKINLSNEITGNDELGYTKFDMYYLHQYRSRHEFLYIQISDPSRTYNSVKIYLQQVVEKQEITIDDDGLIHFKHDIKNFEPNSLTMFIYVGEKEIIRKKIDGKTILLEDIETQIRYDIKIMQTPDIIAGKTEKYLLETSYFLSDATKLNGLRIKVESIFCFRFDKKDEIVYEKMSIEPIVIEIGDRIVFGSEIYSRFDYENNIVYECKLYKLNQFNKLKPFNCISGIHIELKSPKQYRTLRFMIVDEEGDELMLSKENNKYFISDSADGKGDYVVDYMVINLERDKYYD